MKSMLSRCGVIPVFDSPFGILHSAFFMVMPTGALSR